MKDYGIRVLMVAGWLALCLLNACNPDLALSAEKPDALYEAALDATIDAYPLFSVVETGTVSLYCDPDANPRRVIRCDAYVDDQDGALVSKRRIRIKPSRRCKPRLSAEWLGCVRVVYQDDADANDRPLGWRVAWYRIA